MSRGEILLLSPILARIGALLEAEHAVYRLWEADHGERRIDELAGRITALGTDAFRGADAALLDRFPKLELVASFGVGLETLDLDHATRRGIRVTRTPGVLDDDVADLALGLLLATSRRIAAGDRYVRDGRWPQGELPLARKVSGKRLGILGLGRIGKAVARRALGFDLEVHYHGRTAQPDQPFAYHADPVALARAVDFLVVLVPGGEATRGIVNREVMRALGPEGTLINVARGSVVDEPALVELLERGELGAAGLDVFAREPQVPEALWTMENVVLQPHLGSATHETRTAMGDLVLANLQAHFAGRPLPSPAN